MRFQLVQSLRSLRKAAGFTFTAAGTLGLAVGASAAIFTVVDTVLLDPLPYPDTDRLVMLRGSAPGTDLGDDFNLAAEFLVEYQRDADMLENIASFNMFTSTFRTEARVERIRMSAPTLSLFDTLGIRPELGRLPQPDELLSAAVLSHRLWMEWFDGDPDVIGRSAQAAGRAVTIVGVMPARFDFPNEGTMLWFPTTLGVAETEITPGRFGNALVARVRPGVGDEALVAQLEQIAKRLPEQYGGSAAYTDIIERLSIRIVPWRDALLGPLELPLMILLGATGILWLIACANVANLFAVRIESQRRDVAIRRAIGAPRNLLIGRQLIESVCVALLAAVLALVVAALLLPVIVTQVPEGVPRISGAQLSALTIAYTFSVSVLAGLVCGMLPAFRVAGVSLRWLRDASRSATRSRHRVRDALVVVQAALALLLLVGSGLLFRSLAELRDVDAGYDTSNIFTFQFAPEQAQLRDAASWAGFHLEFMDRLRALPGVETVGIVENFPLDEGVGSRGFSTELGAGRAAPEQFLNLTFAAGDYFEAMGIALLRGRTFTESEHRVNPGYVVVSLSTAERLWPGEDPIGKRLRSNDLDTWETVIGVVEDVRQYGFRNEEGPELYFPLVPQPQTVGGWSLSTPAYVLKTTRASTIAPEVRALVREVAPEAPMYRVFTIEELVADSLAQLSFTMIALALAAGLALTLGMVGLYGLLSSGVAERTRELGIRIALGANPGRVRRMVVIEALRVVGLGILVGMLGVLAVGQGLGSLLFGVGTFDTITLFGTVVLMLLVGIVASWIPAYRASSIDPVETLAEA